MGTFSDQTNKTEKIIPSPYKHIWIASLIVFSVISIGTLGYSLIENWSIIDSLYMTIITMATVGFKEVMPLSTYGKIFTILLIFVGVGAFAFTFGTIAELFILGTLKNYLGRTKMEMELKKIKEHVILCGYGRMGKVIAEQFIQQKMPYVIIDTDEAKIQNLQKEGMLAIVGDAGTEETLIRAGAERAKSLIGTCTNDASNLLVTITARGINNALYIVSRAIDPTSEKKMIQVGANKIISPYYLGGLRIAQAVMWPSAFKFIETSTLKSSFGLTINEFPISENSKLIGKKISETHIKEEYNIMILGISKNEQRMIFNPPSNIIIDKKDRLILMGDPNNLAKFSDWAGLEKN